MYESILTGMQLFLTCGNVCIMLYALKKFLAKPQETLVERVIALEAKTRELEASLLKGNDRFREQEDTNEMVLNVMLAFVDFEIAFCIHTDYEHKEDLYKAKNVLQAYLAKRHNTD